MKHWKIALAVLITVAAAAVSFFFFSLYQEKFKTLTDNFFGSEIEKNIETETMPSGTQNVMVFIEKNINNFAPYLPVEGEKWNVLRFGVATDRDYYVEAEDGHNLIRLLLSCQNFDGSFSCKRIADFVVDAFVWKIGNGEDSYAARKISYFEKDSRGEWTFLFYSTDKKTFPISQDALIDMQKTYDKGYLAWRNKPISVMRRDLPSEIGFDLNSGNYELISQSLSQGRIVYQIEYKQEKWNVIIYQPVKVGEGGIWVIREMIKT